ncbi:MAG: circadian clock protein KaiC, partial [Rhodospirillales bacterium]|nr:circadian clock protein KaiC [Rhodospirillales bacterium]
MPQEIGTSPGRVSTGIPGLDDILGGGLFPNRLYLAEGQPGTGKTTLALQFLLEGTRRGERSLYVTLAETKEEIEDVARSHGWSLEALDVFELVPPEAGLEREREQTLLHPSEVELGETTQLIFDRVDAVAPVRVVFDSLSEMRLLARNSLRYRRQILALKHFFTGRKCTVLLLDDSTAEEDVRLHSVPHGVMQLEQLPREYGAERRRIRVVKMRGMPFRGGYHDLVIETGGITVYPRLSAAGYKNPVGDVMASGVEGLDALLGGGLARGTNALLIGPSGAGKTTLALHYALAAASRGERASIFAFDETEATLRARSIGFGMPLEEYIAQDLIRLKQVDPAELSPGEFLHHVRTAVERDGVRVVIIDTLNGYLNAMPEEQFLILQMHDLLSWLNQYGVLSILVMAQHGILGDMKS